MASDDRSWSAMLGIGLAAALLLVAGLVIGWVADTLLDTTPILLFVGLVIGIAAAGSYIYLRFRDSLNRDSPNR
jgi:F0F1-type ATP synthase assembly protein I